MPLVPEYMLRVIKEMPVTLGGAIYLVSTRTPLGEQLLEGSFAVSQLKRKEEELQDLRQRIAELEEVMAKSISNLDPDQP